MILYSPFSMLETLRIHPRKRGGSQEGAEEGGEEERVFKSYEADQRLV